MDEVLAQWLEKVVRYYNEDYGTSFTRNDIQTWDVCLNLGPGSETALRSYMRYDRFYDDLEPMPGALEGVKKLVDDGHDVMIATAVPKSATMAYSGKVAWLHRFMPFFPINNFMATQRKYLLASCADVLLDDGMHNIIPWAKMGKPAVIFDAPWNQTDSPDAAAQDLTGLPIQRIKHWNEFLKLIDGMSSKKKP